MNIFAVVRLKETGRHYLRIQSRGFGMWTDNFENATTFDGAFLALKSIEKTPEKRYDKFVGTRSEIEEWLQNMKDRDAMRKIQDQVNASIKKIADVTMAPNLFISKEQADSLSLQVDGYEPKQDPVLAVIETYIEKAQEIEENGAGEYTWRGFLHSFLKDVLEAR